MIGFVRALLAAVSSITTWMRDRQLIEAGEAQATLEGVERAQQAMRRARAARRNVDHDIDSVLRDRNNRDSR